MKKAGKGTAEIEDLLERCILQEKAQVWVENYGKLDAHARDEFIVYAKSSDVPFTWISETKETVLESYTTDLERNSQE